MPDQNNRDAIVARLRQRVAKLDTTKHISLPVETVRVLIGASPEPVAEAAIAAPILIETAADAPVDPVVAVPVTPPARKRK